MWVGEKCSRALSRWAVRCLWQGLVLRVLQGWALLGVLAAFAQAITWGAEVVFLKATATRDRASRILFIVNVAASVMVLATGVWFWESLMIEVILLVAAMGLIAILGQNLQYSRVSFDQCD